MPSDYTVRIWVPGPALSERKRQRIHKRRNGESVIGARTDEPDRKNWKQVIAAYARQVQPQPLHGPLILTCYVSRKIPASYPKRPTNSNPYPWAWIRKPDADNFTKIISDAIVSAGIIEDDAQFLSSGTVKVQKDFDGVVIEIKEALQDDWDRYADLVEYYATQTN